MYSNNAAICLVTGVRPVCQNTLTIGIQKATTKMVIPHTPGAKDKVEHWLREMYQATTGVIRVATSDFERMAEAHLKTSESKHLLEQVYPNPMLPKEEWHMQFGLTFEQHQERYEEKREKVLAVRNTVLQLFGGEGQGMDTPAADGTAWGLYNAVSEFEDNRLGSGEGRALGVTVGERANTVRKAYNVINDYCKN